MALLFKHVAVVVLLVFLHTRPLVARSDSVAKTTVIEAVNERSATGRDFRTHKSKFMDCKACRAASRASFGKTQHFVGVHVGEAAKEFCTELKYRGLIGDKATVRCTQILIKESVKSKRIQYGVPYMKASDVCAFYGACGGKTM